MWSSFLLFVACQALSRAIDPEFITLFSPIPVYRLLIVQLTSIPRSHTRFAPRRPKTWINQNAGGGNTGTGPGGATGGGAGGITTTALRGHSTISRAMGSGTSICDRCGNFHGVGECPVCTNTVADSDQFDSAVLSAVFGLLNTNVGDSRRITNDDSIIRSPRDGWQQVMKNIVLQWALADAIQKQVADLEEAGGNVGSSEELSNYADYRLDPPLENSSSGFYSRSSTSTSPLKRSSTSSAASPAKRGKRESLLSSPRIMSTSADTNSNDTFNANRESMRRQIAAFALKQAGADGLKRLAQSWKDGGVTTEWNPILSSSALTDSTPAVESTPAITAFVAQLNAAGSEPLTPEQFRRMAQRQKDQSSTTQPIYGPNAAWVK
ncbi:hypothetical protein F5Y16DRAFT_316150 [Xylariaceae sp. FL0255]|nr:hypothetical protein F5Y16DRAFT_316150 [Xylariaceae sp. FL0255]